jgi:hypothetical protein
MAGQPSSLLASPKPNTYIVPIHMAIRAVVLILAALALPLLHGAAVDEGALPPGRCVCSATPPYPSCCEEGHKFSPNNLETTPLRGWRSWQAFAHDVNQAIMEDTMRGLAKKRPFGPGGAMVSLADAGYLDAGLDAGYEMIGQVRTPRTGAEGWRQRAHPGAPPSASSSLNHHQLHLTQLTHMCRGMAAAATRRTATCSSTKRGSRRSTR